ncbi:hypothetical protein IKF12_02285 [Candidatus Saccharibacteria bacterium]|nr:hypothetical protein [Candidatus Saccharibacteria bacterium]
MTNNKNSLKILCCVFGVVILGLVVAIIVVLVRPKESVITISDIVESQTNPVSNSAVAFMFDEEIQNNLGEGYSYDDAIYDYQKAYDESTGSMKIYIAVEYADFLYYELARLDDAIDILEKVGDLPDDKVVLHVYYGKLLELYEAKGDEEKIEQCKELLSGLNGEEKAVSDDYLMEVMGGDNGQED